MIQRSPPWPCSGLAKGSIGGRSTFGAGAIGRPETASRKLATMPTREATPPIQTAGPSEAPSRCASPSGPRNREPRSPRRQAPPKSHRRRARGRSIRPGAGPARESDDRHTRAHEEECQQEPFQARQLVRRSVRNCRYDTEPDDVVSQGRKSETSTTAAATALATVPPVNGVLRGPSNAFIALPALESRSPDEREQHKPLRIPRTGSEFRQRKWTAGRVADGRARRRCPRSPLRPRPALAVGRARVIPSRSRYHPSPAPT